MARVMEALGRAIPRFRNAAEKQIKPLVTLPLPTSGETPASQPYDAIAACDRILARQREHMTPEEIGRCDEFEQRLKDPTTYWQTLLRHKKDMNEVYRTSKIGPIPYPNAERERFNTFAAIVEKQKAKRENS